MRMNGRSQVRCALVAVRSGMGALGFLGIRYPEPMAGPEMDIAGHGDLLRGVWDARLWRVLHYSQLVTTDMAFTDLANAGTDDQMGRYMPISNQRRWHHGSGGDRA